MKSGLMSSKYHSFDYQLRCSLLYYLNTNNTEKRKEIPYSERILY